MRPAIDSHPPYFSSYIGLVKEDNVLDALETNGRDTEQFIRSLDEAKADYAYAEGKWTVKQVLGHIIDAERIFSYRALRFARKDPQQPLPFGEDDYAAAADMSARSLADLAEEFSAVRRATLLLYRSLSPETLLLTGNTAIGKASVLAIGYMICGHCAHHISVIAGRYR